MGGSRKDTDRGDVSARTFPAYIRRNRAWALSEGRCERMSCLSESVVVVLGHDMASERSGIESKIEFSDILTTASPKPNFCSMISLSTDLASPRNARNF